MYCLPESALGVKNQLFDGADHDDQGTFIDGLKFHVLEDIRPHLTPPGSVTYFDFDPVRPDIFWGAVRGLVRPFRNM